MKTIENSKCENCWKEQNIDIYCQECLDWLNEISEKLSWKKKFFFDYLIFPKDQFEVVRYCKWKSKRFTRKAFRTYFNRCWYESMVKNSLWKYYKIKL